MFFIKTAIELAMIGLVAALFIGYAPHATAQGVYYEDDIGGTVTNPNPLRHGERRRPLQRYYEPSRRSYGEDRPYHYGPVDQRPEITIYRGRGRGYRGY